MKMEEGYPNFINDVFKGVPCINAAFTWGKDGSTYFFKGPFVKYNDKSIKVEEDILKN